MQDNFDVIAGSTYDLPKLVPRSVDRPIQIKRHRVGRFLKPATYGQFWAPTDTTRWAPDAEKKQGKNHSSGSATSSRISCGAPQTTASPSTSRHDAGGQLGEDDAALMEPKGAMGWRAPRRFGVRCPHRDTVTRLFPTAKTSNPREDVWIGAMGLGARPPTELVNRIESDSRGSLESDKRVGTRNADGLADRTRPC